MKNHLNHVTSVVSQCKMSEINNNEIKDETVFGSGVGQIGPKNPKDFLNQNQN